MTRATDNYRIIASTSKDTIPTHKLKIAKIGGKRRMSAYDKIRTITANQRIRLKRYGVLRGIKPATPQRIITFAAIQPIIAFTTNKAVIALNAEHTIRCDAAI